MPSSSVTRRRPLYHPYRRPRPLAPMESTVTESPPRPSDRALYEMNPTGRFSDRAQAYSRHRPSYPAPAVDAMLAGLGEPARLSAADIGAGTGISSRLLAERGLTVHAVEPNQAMREAAEPHRL